MHRHPLPGALRLTTVPALLLALGLLSACAPIPTQPAAPERLQGEALGLAAAPGATAAVDTAWWRAWGDERLDALMDKALRDAPSLALARARIAKAGAAVDNAAAADKPVIGIGLDVERQRFSEHGMYPPPLVGNVYNTATLQAGISYDWDFFGRHQAALQASLGQQRALQAESEAARLNIATAVLRAWLGLARSVSQEHLLQQQIELRQQALDLVKQRRAAGLDTDIDLRGAEAPLAELQRQTLAPQQLAQAFRVQLAALSVQPLESLAGWRPALPAAVAAAQAPNLDLLASRPDVRAALARAEAAGYEITAARGRFYPDLTLNAFAGFSSIGLDKLLESGSHQLGFGPSLRLPLFDTGRLRAGFKSAVAEQESAVAAYNAAVVGGVRDAREQWEALQSLQAQQLPQEALLRSNEQQLRLAEERQAAGLGNRLPVIQARQALVQQQRQTLELRAQQLETRVQLMRALGGEAPKREARQNAPA